MSFTFRSVDEGLAGALDWHLAPFGRATQEQHAFSVDVYVQDEDAERDPPLYSFFVGDDPHFRHHSLAQVLGHAIWELHDAVPKRSGDFLSLHAGAVARDGGAILLPAGMDSGKSSLVVALLERGFSYLSDEVAALDPVTGRVYPFPKRIRLDPEALRFFGGLAGRLGDREGLSASLSQRFVRPEDVGVLVADPAPARWLVFPMADWSGPARLSPLSRAEAVARMAAASFNLYRYEERGVVMLTRVAGSARAFLLTGGTPRERAELLAEAFN